MDVTFGIILASAIPLAILGFMRTSDFYQIGKYHLIVSSLLGGIVAYLVASVVNSFLNMTGDFDETIRENFIAPPLEELLKGLVLLYLIQLAKISFSVDGALYGFAIGIGFAIAENIGYVTDPQVIPVDTALQRIFSANLVHATCSAILGIALGMSYLRRIRARGIILAAGLSLAIVIHMFYNFIVNRGGASLASAFGIGVLGAFLIYLAMQRGKRQAQDWIRQKLGMRDGVTAGEVALVNRLPTTDDLLQPVFERFGLERARQVEALLYLQARLGIKRKFLDNIQKNDPLHSTLERELREMRTEMKEVQRAIGAYSMLFVRGLYTDEMVSVWERIQAKIQGRSAGNSGQTGGGLWSSLEERLKSRSDTERYE